mgnify:CR=1 FL=1
MSTEIDHREGPRWSRRVRGLRAAARGAVATFGSALLSNALTRDLLNSALRKGGCVETAWYPRLFDRFRPSKPFLWVCSFRGRDIIIPVLPRYRQSWQVVYWMHWHEKHLVWLWDLFLQYYPSPVFLDVGANFGVHTFRLAAAGASCFAIEPQNECLSYLQLVTALNGWNVTTEQCAFAEKAGVVVLHRARETSMSSLLEGWVERRDEPASQEEVPSTTLDAFCLAHCCVPDLIKVDVEGAEERVVAGAGECMRSGRATWVI